MIYNNFLAVNNALPMNKSEIAQFTLNAIEASFISQSEKQRLTLATQDYIELHQ